MKALTDAQYSASITTEQCTPNNADLIISRFEIDTVAQVESFCFRPGDTCCHTFSAIDWLQFARFRAFVTSPATIRVDSMARIFTQRARSYG